MIIFSAVIDQKRGFCAAAATTVRRNNVYLLFVIHFHCLPINVILLENRLFSLHFQCTLHRELLRLENYAKRCLGWRFAVVWCARTSGIIINIRWLPIGIGSSLAMNLILVHFVYLAGPTFQTCPRYFFLLVSPPV